MSRANFGPHDTSSASSTSNGVVTRSGRTRLKDMSLKSAWKLSSASREKQSSTTPWGVCLQKKFSGTDAALGYAANGLRVTFNFKASQGCRRVMGSVRRNHVRGGTDDINTAAGTTLDSRNFWTMNPPMECPMSTGSVGNLPTTDVKSST